MCISCEKSMRSSMQPFQSFSASMLITLTYSPPRPSLTPSLLYNNNKKASVYCSDQVFKKCPLGGFLWTE